MASGIARARAEISADDSKLQRTLGRAQRSLNRFSSRGAAGFDAVGRAALNLTGSLARVGAAAGIAVTAIAGLTVREAATEIGNFGEAISKVEGLTGLERTSEAFAALRAEARELGASTQFSATQAADGMAFLAQAGFKANQILESSEHFLNLAAAGSLELAESMDIASNIMSGFGLPASEAARVADVLSAASSATNTNVSQLGEAFKAAGPVAKLLGIEIEDAAAAIGVLGNVGIQGSDAGTALRNIMLRLASGGSEVSAGLAAMNLTLQDVSPSANSVSDVFAKLIDSTKTAGLTADETAGAFSKVFGVRATAAGASLAGLNLDVKALSESFRNVDGTAKRMAETFTDNLPGDIKKFQSALAELFLTAGDAGFESSLRSATGSATEFIRTLGESQGLQNFVRSVTQDLDGALQAISKRLENTDFDSVFDNLSDTFSDFQIATKKVIGLVTYLTDRLDFDGTFDALFDSTNRIVTAFGGFEGSTFNVAAAIRSTTDVLVPLIEVAAPIARVMVENAGAIIALGAAFKGLAVASTAISAFQTLTTAVTSARVAFGSLATQITATNGALAANSTASKAAAAASGAQGAAAGAAYGSKFTGALSIAGPAIGAAIVGWGIGKLLDEEFRISDNINAVLSDMVGYNGAIENSAAGVAIARRDELNSAESLSQINSADRQITRDIEDLQKRVLRLKGEDLAVAKGQLRLLIALQSNMDTYRAKISEATEQGVNLGDALELATRERRGIEVTVVADVEPANAEIGKLEGKVISTDLNLDTSAAEAKIADLKIQAEQITPDEAFDQFGFFDTDTIQGIQGRINELEQVRDTSTIGSDIFDEATTEINQLQETLKQTRSDFEAVNAAAAKAAVQLNETADTEQRGIARGEEALRNRFERLSKSDRSKFDNFDDFKSGKGDPFSFLRTDEERENRIEESRADRERDRLNVETIPEPDTSGFDKTLADFHKGIENTKDQLAPVEKDPSIEKESRSDFLERELNKSKDREGLLNRDRRQEAEDREKGNLRKILKPEPEEPAAEKAGPMAKSLAALKQLVVQAGKIEVNTKGMHDVLIERLPTKAI